MTYDPQPYPSQSHKPIHDNKLIIVSRNSQCSTKTRTRLPLINHERKAKKKKKKKKKKKTKKCQRAKEFKTAEKAE
ncbi:hypothetical protein I7I53_04094 [Histoplasma capsulatum var. duboisii H88]|uniref:Uncharacterized protein n=1 Tax=Ajellomyces capsulatus (strain H88) TaxID=544711 RepID=A0A8A1LVP2_AJEC8|nr:hypothetical protein I7I53_04094 [Histoplasma capsulatum var. duboisii H88]